MPNFSAYAASKAAVVRFGETLAQEVAGYNITVNSVAPGALNTKMLKEVIAAGEKRVGVDFYAKSMVQQAKGGDPIKNAAELCAQLASEQGGRVSGKLISVKWDNWQEWDNFVEWCSDSELYTLRRTTE